MRHAAPRAGVSPEVRSRLRGRALRRRPARGAPPRRRLPRAGQREPAPPAPAAADAGRDGTEIERFVFFSRDVPRSTRAASASRRARARAGGVAGAVGRRARVGHARRAHRGVARVRGPARAGRRGGVSGGVDGGGARSRRVAFARFAFGFATLARDARRVFFANLPQGRRRRRALELFRVRRDARAPRRRRRRRRNRRAPALVRRAGGARERRRDVVRGDEDPRGSGAAPGDARDARRPVDGSSFRLDAT